MADSDNDTTPNNDGKSSSDPNGFVIRVLIVYGIGLIFLLLMALLWVAAPVLLLVFAALLLAVLLHGASRAIGGWLRLPDPLSLALVLFLSALVLGLAGLGLAPQMSEQFDQILVTLPQSAEALREYLERFTWARALLRNLPPPETLLSAASDTLLHFGTLFTGVVGAFVNTLIIIFVAVYLAIRPQTYVNGFLRLLPKVKRRRGKRVLHHLGDTLQAWLIGKLLSMVVVGSAISVGLLLLDVPLALALGLLAGLLDFIPYIGPLLAAIPAVLIAFSKSPGLALSVIVMFIIMQSAESYLLLPLVERKTVALPPALTISMQVLMGLLFGLMGVALATPLTAVMTELVKKLYVQGVLGDHARI